MSTITPEAPPSAAAPTPEPVIALKRRTIDSVLISFGVLVAIVFATAGGLLTWGHNFSSNYVHDELTSQHVSFPDAADLTTEGRTDLLGHASHVVNSGSEAQAYASYINGHLTKIGAGSTFADLKVPLDAANAAVTAAKTANASDADVAALQAKATAITGQRNSLFQGETLRGLLLSAYAWSVVGMIAGIAAIAAFIASAIMFGLVALGLVHHHKLAKR